MYFVKYKMIKSNCVCVKLSNCKQQAHDLMRHYLLAVHFSMTQCASKYPTTTTLHIVLLLNQIHLCV